MTLAVPVAPKVSKSVSQYSPAPVVNTSPSRQQNSATAAVRTGFLTCDQHEMQTKVTFGNKLHLVQSGMVKQGGGETLNDANLGAEAEGEQHQEEEG